MNKKEFLKILSNNLKNISSSEKKEIISDYEEHFDFGIKDGKGENEIIRSLGNPKMIAKQYNLDTIIKDVEKTHSVSGIIKAVFASLGLGFFNIIFILGPFIGLLSVLISLFASSITVVLSGFLLFIMTIIEPLLKSFVTIGINPFAVLFLSIGLISSGLLLFIGSCYLAKYFYKVTIKYIKLNLNFIKKRSRGVN